MPANEMLRTVSKGYLLVGPIRDADLPRRLATTTPSVPSVGADAVRGEQVRRVAQSSCRSRRSPDPGTWVNVEGTGRACRYALPPGAARPGWKVLRVLGNLLGVAGFDYASSEEIRDELKRELGEFRSDVPRAEGYRAGHINGVDTVREVGIYDVDAIVRRSRPLQETVDAHAAAGATGANATAGPNAVAGATG
jgi:NADH-quinone oxidoreductase subunit G